ncbi:hypothetical protein D3C86_468540 [compost metagenome]
MSDLSAIGGSGSSLNEEAIRRHQKLLSELNIRRLQEQLLKSIVGSDSLEDSSSFSYFMDQLALNDVSQLEKQWLSSLERETGMTFQKSEVYQSLTSLLTQFNSSET